MLFSKIAEAAKAGVDFVQLREKDLSGRVLLEVARQAMRIIRETPASPTRLLINSRADIAIAAGAHGVHLRSVDISPQDVRRIWNHSFGRSSRPVITTACHSVSEVALATEYGADFALFGPVFGKKDTDADTVSTGLGLLREASERQIPVLALGGITLENVRACVHAGALGIAGIRLFQENEIPEVVRQLEP